jgi:hypothetical protein
MIQSTANRRRPRPRVSITIRAISLRAYKLDENGQPTGESVELLKRPTTAALWLR